tara:strand:- start:50965 stop:51438 length:474 start_codon:yes stop_codon:yes gene_type:complete
MAVCDANFIRILQLLPSLKYGVRREISFSNALGSGAQELDLSITSLEVIESFKYTSTLKISHSVNSRANNKVNKLSHYQAPEMLVRMYHDAKTAEVISFQQARFIKARYPLPNPEMYQADEKEQINFFLSEWLTFCRKEGLCSGTTLAENLPAKTAA